MQGLLATLYIPAPDNACLYERWCDASHRLSGLFHIGIVTDKPRTLCAPTIIPSDDATILYRNRSRPPESKSITSKAFSFINLLKWELIKKTQYDFVLFSDLDVDLLFYNSDVQWEKAFARNFPSFLNGNKSLLANRDHSSPVNGGLWIVKPSMKDYRKGLEALRRPFNLSHGFLGVPSTMPPHLRDNSKFFRENTWDFVGGNSDQGLLTAIFFLTGRTTLPVHKFFVRHFWAKSTPWLKKNCKRYFEVTTKHSARCKPFSLISDKCGGVRMSIF